MMIDLFPEVPVPVLKPILDVPYTFGTYRVDWRVLFNGKVRDDHPEDFCQANIRVFFANRNGGKHPLNRKDAGVWLIQRLLEEHLASVYAWEKGYLNLPLRYSEMRDSDVGKKREVVENVLRLLNVTTEILSIERVSQFGTNVDFHLVLEE